MRFRKVWREVTVESNTEFSKMILENFERMNIMETCSLGFGELQSNTSGGGQLLLLMEGQENQ